MDQKTAESLLRKEGFTHIFAGKEFPNIVYPSHTHPEIAAHIVVEGEMIITVERKRHVLNAGNRFDVPAGIAHSAKMGPNGCVYVVGRR